MSFDMIAVDAPIVAPGFRVERPRRCEQLLSWGYFQKHCKPGYSHVHGTGRDLRRAGRETVAQFAPYARGTPVACQFPRICPGRNVVEAFPNAFLGVMCDKAAYAGRPIRRGEKSDRLFGHCVREGILDELLCWLNWQKRAGPLRTAFAERNHDKRAAVVCALSAACVLQGKYVAIGDRRAGYIFLPPWPFWYKEAREGLRRNLTDRRLTLAAPLPEIWINGRRFGPRDPLP
jgi:predicted RNase H-like nuclease